jgi:Ni/Co efflux regulator RcnB
MTRRSLVCAVLALSFLPFVPAAAKGNKNHEQHCGPGHHQCNDERRDDYGPDRAYHRGDRLPPQYRTYQYVVEDWHSHGLRQPPRGYRWVQSGGDYILVAITTGLILELLLNR